MYWKVGSCFDWVFTSVYQCSLCWWLWEQLHSLLTAITISASNTVQEKYWEHKPNLLPSCKNYHPEYRVNHSVFKIFWHSCKQFRFLKNFVGIKTSDIECWKLKTSGRHNDYLSNVLLNQALQPRNLQEFRCPHLNSVS